MKICKNDTFEYFERFYYRKKTLVTASRNRRNKLISLQSYTIIIRASHCSFWNKNYSKSLSVEIIPDIIWNIVRSHMFLHHMRFIFLICFTLLAVDIWRRIRLVSRHWIKLWIIRGRNSNMSKWIIWKWIWSRQEAAWWRWLVEINRSRICRTCIGWSKTTTVWSSAQLKQNFYMSVFTLVLDRLPHYSPNECSTFV